jgi:hypothetical protein
MKLTEIQPLLVAALPSMSNSDIENVIRQTRNYLLQQSDWTQLADSPFTDQERSDWATYRQALRDILENYAGDLAEIVFPTAPTA